MSYRRLKAVCLLFWIFLPISCATVRKAPAIRFPYLWLDKQGFGGDIDRVGFPEPSGICFHPKRKTLFVVSDEGELMEMGLDGSPMFRQKIAGDLEGITCHPETGLLYIIVEGDDVILEYDRDLMDVKRKFPLNRAYGGDPEFLQKQVDAYDNGIEDIAFVPRKDHPEGGTFYICNQWDPPCIMDVLVPLRSSPDPVHEAYILKVLPFRIDDPAAMYYDNNRRILNVVSDADNILVELTLHGRLVNEYAFLGDNQEGIAVDDEGYLYIAQDTGGILKVKDLRR